MATDAAGRDVSQPPADPAPSGTVPADAVTGAGDPAAVRTQLRTVDELLAEYHMERRIALELQAQKAAEREHFARSGTHAFRCVVKPALQRVADRLAQDGVGGLVEEVPQSGRLGTRLVLWMSLDGPIVSAPRQDRNPYLQLDLDVDRREVRVWEGDMWLHLGSSRPADPLTLDQLTAEVVTGRALEVLRRAAAHGQEMLTNVVRGADPV